MACSCRRNCLALVLIAAFSLLQPASSTSEADEIRIQDPCATELGVATSDNLACFAVDSQASTPECFNQSSLCDGEMFCRNGTDEGMDSTAESRIICGADNSPDMFFCASGESMVLTKVCDGNKDCSRGEDERFILCRNKCLGSYYGGCPITRRCESSTDSVRCGECFSGYTADPSSPTGDCLPVINITFESPLYTVTEGSAQHVEVCVNTTDTRIKSQQRLNLTLVITTGEVSPATEGADYIAPPIALRQLTVTRSQPRRCVNITIVDDHIIEDREVFFVSLQTADGPQVRIIDPMSTEVNIFDNDVIEVGFADTCYIINQTSLSVFLCIVIMNSVTTLSTSTPLSVSLAIEESCHEHEPLLFPTSLIGNARSRVITSNRTCSSVPTRLDTSNTCQNFSLLQQCQFQIDRPPIFAFLNPTTTRACLPDLVGQSYCNAENVTTNGMTYIWPRTIAGSTAEYTCPNNPRFSVSRLCMSCMSTGIWQDFDRLGCGALTSELQDILDTVMLPGSPDGRSVAESVDRLAGAIAASTDRPVDQTTDNLETTALILSRVGDFVRVEPSFLGDGEVIRGSTQTIDSLLQWTPEAVTTQAGSKVIQSFEVISSAYAEQLPINTTESISLQSVNLISQMSSLETLREGRSITYMGGSNFTIENAIPLTNVTFNLPMDEPGTTHPTISLPPSIFERLSPVANSTALVFALYAQPTLFPVGNTSAVGSRRERINGTETRVGSQIISAIVVQDSANFENLTDPVQVLLPVEINTSFPLLPGTESCVTWDFDLQRWSTKGCRTSVTRNGSVLCTCDHLTNFAVLVDICLRHDGCQPIDEVVDIILSFISYIGIVVSIVGLSATIITMLAFKKLRGKDVTPYHVQLCISLLLMYICSLALVVTGSLDTPNILYGGCIVVSVTVHYFALVAVMWMGAEALVMFQKVIIVFVRLTTLQLTIVSIICWMVPVIPVLATLIADQLSGSDPEGDLIIRRSGHLSLCFLSHPGVFWGAFLGPILLIMLFNVVVFFCVIVVLIRHVRGTSAQQKVKNEGVKTKKVLRVMFSIGGIMALFGLSWLFGALTISVVPGLRETFQILFTIFNSFQGFFVFLFFCVLNKGARQSWQAKFCPRRLKRKKPSTFFTSLGKQPSMATPMQDDSSAGAVKQKTEPKVMALPLFETRVPSSASMTSPSASKQGRVLGMDDVPETSTFHAMPSKATFIT